MSKKKRKNKRVQVTKKQEEVGVMENNKPEVEQEVVQENVNEEVVVEQENKEQEVVQEDNNATNEKVVLEMTKDEYEEYLCNQKIKEEEASMKRKEVNLTQSDLKRFKEVNKLLEDYELFYKEKYDVEISGEMTDGEIKELEDTLKTKIKEKIQEMKQEEAAQNKDEEVNEEKEELDENKQEGEGIFKRFLKGLATIIAGLIATIVFVIALPFTTIGAMFKRNKKEAQSSKHKE